MDEYPPEALLEAYPAAIRYLAEQLRAVVAAAVPEAIERVRDGWHLIGYDLPRPGGRAGGRPRATFFAWIMPERRHVHLGFTHGTLLADPAGTLLGRGITKRARWLTFRPGDAIDAAVARGFLLDAAAVARRDPRDRNAELVLAALQAEQAEPVEPGAPAAPAATAALVAPAARGRHL